jgi:anaerobic C4-dicarboxylate transporter
MLRAICFLAVLAATQAASLRAMPTAADMARDQDKVRYCAPLPLSFVKLVRTF